MTDSPPTPAGTTAEAAVDDLIRRFERLSPRRRIEAQDAARAGLGRLRLSDAVKLQLWEACFVPLVRQAQEAVTTQRAAVAENAGGVVLRAVADLVARHPRRLDRATCAAVVTGDVAWRGDDPAYGVAEGVEPDAVVRVIDQLVAKGLLEEAGGRLAPGKPAR